MGSHMNFKNFGDASSGEGGNLRPVGNLPLARQSSVYSLTLDEFQNTLGGMGKDFGSMNMDELLKNIWSAEETQAMSSSAGGGGEGGVPGSNLQRQGSLTLPRTLSQKTVDEVWRDLIKESSVGVAAKDVSDGVGGGAGGANMPQRQQTLGEMTLEEFLVRAGVVREDTQQFGRPNNTGFYGNNTASLALGYQQQTQNHGLLGNRAPVPNQPSSFGLNVGRIRMSQQQPQQQQQPLFPKQATVAFASPVHLVNGGQLTSPASRGSIVGIGDPSLNNNLVQAGGLHSGGGIGMVGLGTGGVTVAAGSPGRQISPDVISKSSADNSSLSPVPYMFGRGRKCSAALEKVVERRQRRMIKNRESAARSRARKQAYTMELEAEVAKLKELNQELERKQAEIMEMQKTQLLDTMNQPWRSKRQCLRRTLTGPW